MNLNKNISIWRRDSTPPTNYQFWIKSDGNVFINSGTEFEDYKDLSGINDDIQDINEDIQDINNVLYNQYTKVTITATPTIIEKGVNKDIILSWGSTFNDIAIIPDTTSVKRDGTEIYKDANAQHLVPISDTTTFTIDIQYKGVTKTASTKVNAYYPKYYGYSTKATLTSSDILAFTKQTISSSVAGFGSMNVPEGNYVWFCVPSTMTIHKVTSSGFDVPMEAPINVVISGKDTYKCYRSSNTFKAGTFTYQIS